MVAEASHWMSSHAHSHPRGWGSLKIGDESRPRWNRRVFSSTVSTRRSSAKFTRERRFERSRMRQGCHPCPNCGLSVQLHQRLLPGPVLHRVRDAVKLCFLRSINRFGHSNAVRQKPGVVRFTPQWRRGTSRTAIRSNAHRFRWPRHDVCARVEPPEPLRKISGRLGRNAPHW